VSAVVEKFASPASGLKSINFLDNATNTVLGRIWIKEPVTRITLPYSEGFIQKAVDMDTTYTVEQRHLFA
jgi:hypothetical protein